LNRFVDSALANSDAAHALNRIGGLPAVLFGLVESAKRNQHLSVYALNILRARIGFFRK